MPARLSATPRCTSSLQQAHSLLLFRQTVDDPCLSSFYTLLLLSLFSNLAKTGSAQHILLKFP